MLKDSKSASAVKLCTQNGNHQTYQNVSGEHSIHNHMHAVVSVFSRSWTNSIHQQWPGYESETHRQSTTSISTVFTNRWPITVVWSNNFSKTYSGNQLLPLAYGLYAIRNNWIVTDPLQVLALTDKKPDSHSAVHSWTWNHHVDKYGTDSEEILCTSINVEYVSDQLQHPDIQLLSSVWPHLYVSLNLDTSAIFHTVITVYTRI